MCLLALIYAIANVIWVNFLFAPEYIHFPNARQNREIYVRVCTKVDTVTIAVLSASVSKHTCFHGFIIGSPKMIILAIILKKNTSEFKGNKSRNHLDLK